MKVFFSILSFLLPLTGIKEKPRTIYNHFVTDKMQVALTFDDGPSNESTPKVLEILKEKNIKATFFILGENIKKNSEQLKNIVKDGHQIGLHSYTHPNFHQLSAKEIRDELKKNQEEIASYINFKPTIVRPPYGIITNNFLSVATEMNLTIFTWTIDTLDWKSGNNCDCIVSNGLKKLNKGSIILMHDKSKNHLNSIKALPRLIDKIKELGYEFVTLKSEKVNQNEGL
ncbi:MAG TPA: polysaccharide deacetylase [Firmicutes bacterium]|nr:polysaccharide deacetylase [Bacillota bacterium]